MRIARIGKTKQGHLTIHFGILTKTTAEAILTGDLNKLPITADQTWGHRDLQQQDLQADHQVHLVDLALVDQEVVDRIMTFCKRHIAALLGVVLAYSFFSTSALAKTNQTFSGIQKETN